VKPQQATFAEIIAAHAATVPDRDALVFLDNDKEHALTYSALHQQAQTFAHHLVQRGLRGTRVLLLFPSGLDYVVSLLGCLYAGVIAVPLYPPRSTWHAQRFLAIAGDAQASAVLTSCELEDKVRSRLMDAGWAASVPVIGSGALLGALAAAPPLPLPAWDDLAYLQYTSGSTGVPKGVMVRHGDLAGNCAIICDTLQLRPGAPTVSWLPLFHDMGLVLGIMAPLTQAGKAVFMAPAAFVQKPARWLQALSRYRAVASVAPNFAYQLCLDRIPDDELAQCDLSCVASLLCAAEPISYATMQAFSARFVRDGLRPAAQFGAYGLADATLMVTSNAPLQAASVLWLDQKQLAQGVVQMAAAGQDGSRALVSCGRLLADPAVSIVDPRDGSALPSGRIGEIWVAGSTVCPGYWQRPELSEETFGAMLGGLRYLRTGDLGFIHDGELYVAGRLKDLIIVRGENHYPQDIEHTVQQAHPALRKGTASAAFLLDDMDGAPHLVVVQEVERTARKHIDVERIALAIAHAVTEQHGVDVDTVVLIKPSSLPQTSSGKVQRSGCRALLAAGELAELGRWQRSPVASGAAAEGGIAERITQWIAAHTGEPAERIAVTQPFAALGLSSLKLVELVAEAGRWLGRELAPMTAYDYPTIAQLAAYLRDGARPDQSATPATAAAGQAYEPVAIVGLACRLPGADSPEQYWQLIAQGRQMVRGMPDERSRLTGCAVAPDAPYHWGGFLDRIEQFDANLFNIAPREAHSIDPQQRLLLETAWQALEDAQIPADRLAGSATGVYVGISSNDYYRLQRAADGGRDAYSGTGNAFSIAANRISYCFGLQGPSMAIDTACSSSLVAVHQACLSLGRGECSLALAGGVNLCCRLISAWCSARRKCCRRAGAAIPSTPAPMVMCGAKAAAWSCSSGCATPCATATASMP